MKKSQIILLIVFLSISAVIYVILSGNKKDSEKELKSEESVAYVPVATVKNNFREHQLISYGQILPNSEVMVSVEVQGKLERGDLTMKPGVNFRVGQILYRINNEEAFYTLSARKTSLATLVLNAMPDIELDFPSEKGKWIQFMNDLKPTTLLPPLPRMSSSKENMFMTSRNVVSEYYNLKSLEARMEKYFYAAPFNGTVIATYAEPGSIANPGGQLAKIAKTGDFEVKVPISMEDLEMFKAESTTTFTDAKGQKIATGNIIRISDVINQQTQSADVYYSIRPLEGEKIYNGMFVNVAINKAAEKKTMALPRVAVKNGKVNILTQGKIKPQSINIVSSVPDSVFVTGLNDKQIVILEQVEEINPEIRYEGISR